ncbi:unnamed protein product [Lota lota]
MALTQTQSVLNGILAKHQAKKDSLTHKIASDSFCRRVLRNELTSLASLQRKLLSILKKHNHLQEKILTRKASSSPCSPHSVTKRREPGLPSTYTAFSQHLSELTKKQGVLGSLDVRHCSGQKSGKINRDTPKHALKRRFLSGLLMCPPGGATDRSKCHTNGRTSKVGNCKQNTVNTIKDPIPPKSDTPVLKEYSGTSRDLSGVLSPGSALQLLWRVTSDQLPLSSNFLNPAKVTAAMEMTGNDNPSSTEETPSTVMTTMHLPMEIKSIHLVGDEEFMPNGTMELKWAMFLQNSNWD